MNISFDSNISNWGPWVKIICNRNWVKVFNKAGEFHFITSDRYNSFYDEKIVNALLKRVMTIYFSMEGKFTAEETYEMFKSIDSEIRKIDKI